MRTRKEASEELLRRGYTRDEYPGVWIDPNGQKIVWFRAVVKEGIEFDRKDKPWKNNEIQN